MNEPFSPEEKIEPLLAKARAFNDQLDSIDRENGNAAPCDCTDDLLARTVISAITSALAGNYSKGSLEDDSSVTIAQGLCMLQDLELRLRERLEREEMDE